MSCPRKKAGFASGKGLEYCTAAHAEANCIANAARNGTKILDAQMIVNTMPCKNCAVLIVNSGIKEVIVADPQVSYDEVGEVILRECGVRLCELEYDVGQGMFYVPDGKLNDPVIIKRYDEKLNEYIAICNSVSKLSKCYSRKVGAIVVSDWSVLTVGYNGPAKGAKHCNVRQYCLPDGGKSGQNTPSR